LHTALRGQQEAPEDEVTGCPIAPLYPSGEGRKVFLNFLEEVRAVDTVESILEVNF